MTGLLDRLRSWLGAVFGDETADGDDVSAEAEAQVAGDPPTVVHRDDRPLETPSDLDHSPSVESAPVRNASASGADHKGRSDATADDGGAKRDRVSIPDAESVAGGADVSADADRANDQGTADNRDDADDGFACSVCGTAVDDPTEACPLCGATDVRPAGERRDSQHGSPGGRTAVSAADDEAVERLGDVRDADDEGESDDAPAPDGDGTG